MFGSQYRENFRYPLDDEFYFLPRTNSDNAPLPVYSADYDAELFLQERRWTGVVKSDKTDVTNLMLTDFQGLTPVFDATTATYSFSVATGTDVQKRGLTFTLATGTSATPQSGSVQNFTSPVTYTVTAENKTTSKTFTVQVQAPPKSSDKQLLSFSFGSLSPPVQATVNQTAKTITATLPAETNLSTEVSRTLSTKILIQWKHFLHS